MTFNFPSRSTVSIWLLAAAAATWRPVLAADTPTLAPEVHADVLRNEIATAQKTNDLPALLAEIDEYKSLGVAFPNDLLFVEAQAAEKQGDPTRALNALTLFMNKADRRSVQYKQAVSLYPSYAAAAGNQRHVSPSPKPDEDAAKVAASNAQLKAEADAKKADADAKAAQARAIEERPREIAKFVAQLQSELVAISGGKLMMGSYVRELKSAKPVHEVQVAPFRIASTAISCEQFKAYATLSRAPAAEVLCDQAPKITWDQGQRLLGWLNQQSSTQFRLPSESEWEWVAANRSGPARLSVNDRVLERRPGLGFEVQFGTKAVQPEWVADCRHDSYKGAPTNGAAWTEGGDCTQRVLRGATAVRQIQHLQFGADNWYSYDDGAFVQARAFGMAGQACGGLAQCSIRLATGP